MSTPKIYTMVCKERDELKVKLKEALGQVAEEKLIVKGLRDSLDKRTKLDVATVEKAAKYDKLVSVLEEIKETGCDSGRPIDDCRSSMRREWGWCPACIAADALAGKTQAVIPVSFIHELFWWWDRATTYDEGLSYFAGDVYDVLEKLKDGDVVGAKELLAKYKKVES